MIINRQCIKRQSVVCTVLWTFIIVSRTYNDKWFYLSILYGMINSILKGIRNIWSAKDCCFSTPATMHQIKNIILIFFRVPIWQIYDCPFGKLLTFLFICSRFIGIVGKLHQGSLLICHLVILFRNTLN